MKIKVSEATNLQLDWLVAKCEGIHWEQGDLDAGEYGPGFRPSTDWTHGGPLIARKGIEFRASGRQASIAGGQTYYGPTHLVSAMRCYVTSELGDEVEVPEELV